MKRTYLPIADYKIYNDAVDLYMVQSNILNGGAETVPNSRTIIWTKDNLEGYLIEIVGNKDGGYLRNGEYGRAAIPFIKLKIRELEEKYTDYQSRQVKEGYEMPEVMPQRMLDEYYQLQARLTVLQAEAEELRKRLQVYKDSEQKEDDSKVLQYGLVGWATFHTDPRLLNILQQIDGQRITQTEEGLLIINDPRSPYSGMAVVEYRALCRVFFDQQRQKEKVKLKQVQEQCQLEQKPIPIHLGVQAPRKVSRASLPKWPSGVKNWLLKDETPIKKHMIRK
jgi:hypothetical protein